MLWMKTDPKQREWRDVNYVPKKFSGLPTNLQGRDPSEVKPAEVWQGIVPGSVVSLRTPGQNAEVWDPFFEYADPL